ncbi:hypothetical protein [Nocardioides pyridinolyticus]
MGTSPGPTYLDALSLVSEVADRPRLAITMAVRADGRDVPLDGLAGAFPAATGAGRRSSCARTRGSGCARTGSRCPRSSNGWSRPGRCR